MEYLATTGTLVSVGVFAIVGAVIFYVVYRRMAKSTKGGAVPTQPHGGTDPGVMRGKTRDPRKK